MMLQLLLAILLGISAGIITGRHRVWLPSKAGDCGLYDKSNTGHGNHQNPARIIKSKIKEVFARKLSVESFPTRFFPA